MNYLEFGKLLNKYQFITPIWLHVTKMIDENSSDIHARDEVLKLFLMYFSLIEDGNTCMPLDKNRLLIKWNNKIQETEIMLGERKSFDQEEFDEIKKESTNLITNYLVYINDENLYSIINDNGLFVISDNWLYARKYYYACLGISQAITKLFKEFPVQGKLIDYKELVNSNFSLSSKQELVLEKGFTRNLIITGGPGTGKTTSIFFLLFGILLNDRDYNVYLTAPSGKAASRVKESILGSVKRLTEEAKEKYQEVLEKINGLNEYTIHRLLGYDSSTNGFSYNENHLFPKKSIFVIDEASMTDVCIFNSLLSAIDEDSRVFILGDKNQLPSVDSGAVLSDLLKIEKLQDYIVELDESKRFTSSSDIFVLAEAINKGTTLPVNKESWIDYSSFTIMPTIKGKYPIYYYKDYDYNTAEKDIISHIILVWGKEFYECLPDKATGLDPLNISFLEELGALSNKGKILCAENEGVRGTKAINHLIINNYMKSATLDDYGFLPGEVVMITKNNHALDLYNGETGLVVSFKDDNTLYFMIEKETNLVKKEGKKDNSIFKLGKFVFYPIRLISRSEIDFAFAITIHKSQGSDYESILVILPKKEGHPLVNREIIYTAITRTKGNTYILSNQERLEEGKNKALIRDTNIC